MKKFIMILLLLVYASAMPQSDEMIRQWRETTWRLNIVLKGSPHGGAVQFAVMDHDPVKGFRADCDSLRKKSAKMEKDLSHDEIVINETSILSVAWDKQFGDIHGDDLYLLVKGEPCGFSSNARCGRYYIVTKTVMIENKPAAWVIPFSAVTGSEQDIILEDSNLLWLDKASG